MVTREDIEQFVAPTHPISWPDVIATMRQLLTERDEALKLKERYQKLAGEIQVRFEEERRWKEAYRDVAINKDGGYQPKAEERIDAEARQIVEEEI